MTEAEWLTTTDSERMLRFLQFGAAGWLGAGLARLVGRRNVAREQKLRRFVRACFRRIGRTAWEANPREIRDPILLARWCFRVVGDRAAVMGECDEPADWVHGRDYRPPRAADPISSPMPAELRREVRRVAAVRAERDVQCALLRDLFGNPFRPVTIDPQWLTSTVVALASQVYGSRDFSAVPILADALQDAGCDNADVLDHCRRPGPHVRGCWVVDLILGKE